MVRFQREPLPGPTEQYVRDAVPENCVEGRSLSRSVYKKGCRTVCHSLQIVLQMLASPAF